jgi:hypothetical protein
MLHLVVFSKWVEQIRGGSGLKTKTSVSEQKYQLIQKENTTQKAGLQNE